MTGNEKRRMSARCAPHRPTIHTKTNENGECANPAIKRPRQRERENIDICINHCPHPGRDCSGTKRRMEKCRDETERKTL